MEHSNRAQRFAELHQQKALFIMPNPWDAGSAKILQSLGFEALATTSAGFAFSQGKLDEVGALSRQEALDFENGFGDSPDEVHHTILAAAEIGLAGCSIEDTTGNKEDPIYDFPLAKERIAAAVEAVNSLKQPFTLTARAENYLHGKPDFEDTLKRLQAYEEVGADVLYAPGLPNLEKIKTLCDNVSKPVNVVAGIGLQGVSVHELENSGVKRISLGSALARAAIGKTIQAATAALYDGSLHHFNEAASFSDIEALIKQST